MTSDVDYQDKSASFDLLPPLMMKPQPISLRNAGTTSSSSAAIRSVPKVVKVILENIDAMRELILEDCHVTFHVIERSLGF